MKLNTTLNHLGRARTALRDIYTAARIYQQPHSTILENVSKSVYGSPVYKKKLPQWARSALNELDRELLRNTYNHLIWGFWDDGVFYNSFTSLPEPLAEQMRKNELHFAHHWIKNTSHSGAGEVIDGKLVCTYEITTKKFNP